MRWLILVGLCSCSHGEDTLGLPQKSTSTVDTNHLATPAELVHALQLPGAEIDRQLGARHLEARSSIKMTPPGRPIETLEENYRVDSDGKGSVHLVHENTRDGLEVVVNSGRVYVRPRYGHWTFRRAEGDDVERLRRNVEGVAGDYVELLQRWLIVKEVGRTDVNGRPALRLSVTATSSPASAPAETLPYKKWRDTLKVGYVTGEFVVDAASGAQLAGKLEASYTFDRSDLKGQVAVTLQYEAHGGPVALIVVPADAVDPRRARPSLDRETLLQGLPARPAR